MESQELLECPYDKSHRILKHRMQIHLGKCGRNHKNVKILTCPFNVSHQIPRADIEKHIMNCTERKTLENFRNFEEPSTSQCTEPPPPMPVCPSEDNWDEEDAPTYNPSEYVAKAQVIRNIIGASPSERKLFRQQERLRLMEINKKF